MSTFKQNTVESAHISIIGKRERKQSKVEDIQHYKPNKRFALWIMNNEKTGSITLANYARKSFSDSFPSKATSNLLEPINNTSYQGSVLPC